MIFIKRKILWTTGDGSVVYRPVSSSHEQCTLNKFETVAYLVENGILEEVEAPCIQVKGRIKCS